MKRFTLLLIAAILAAFILSPIAGKDVHAVTTPTLPGCAAITSPSSGVLGAAPANVKLFSGQYSFNAGEVITVSFTPGAGFDGANARLNLSGVLVDQKPTVPATLTYTFPATTIVTDPYWKIEMSAGTATYSVTCGIPAAPAPAAPVAPSGSRPGSDMIAIPEQAAMGTFLADTPLYYAPDPIAVTLITMKAGQSLWVFGMNAEGTFYQVVLAGQKLWVPAGVVGPTFIAPWNGQPLPTTVVS